MEMAKAEHHRRRKIRVDRHSAPSLKHSSSATEECFSGGSGDLIHVYEPAHPTAGDDRQTFNMFQEENCQDLDIERFFHELKEGTFVSIVLVLGSGDSDMLESNNSRSLRRHHQVQEE